MSQQQEPRVLLDEGLSRLAAELLRSSGVDAVHVQEVSLFSSDDELILNSARTENRVVFTLDHDFHQLLALRGATSPSVVFLRFEHLIAEKAARLIEAIVRSHAGDLRRGAAISVSASSIRVRYLPLRLIE